MYDVIIIGCGIVGAAAAYELSRYRLSAAVLEKENDVAQGATKANSAILHAGYDPLPGSLMARLNVEGVRLAKELCQKLDVPYRQCGSFVLAFSQEELATLEELRTRGLQNGVRGLKILSGDETRALEPHLSTEVVGALHAPEAAIVSPWEFCLALAETAVRNGVEVHLNHAVTAIKRLPEGWEVETAGGERFAARYLLNAAGVHADAVHDLAAPHAFAIHPARGSYYLLDKSEGGRVNRVIFQCPTKAGKGILVAPTVHGNLIVGPHHEPLMDGEDVAATRAGLDHVAALARKSVPSVRLGENIRNFSGVRAASDRADFIIGEAEGAPGFFDLAGIQSPGLSAAPAIARLAVELLREKGLALTEKENFCGTRKRVRFKELSPEKKAELLAREPAYGQVICRCETVTEGEILQALAGPIPPVSLDGVKRRVSAGMGRCQGGFCGPRVLELLARERGVSPKEILQDKSGSWILSQETKGGGGDV